MIWGGGCIIGWVSWEAHSEMANRRPTGEGSWDPYLGVGKEGSEAQLGRGGGRSHHAPPVRASANLTGSSPDGRVLQSSGLGQEGGAFTLDIREPLGLDGSGREMPCWEEQLSSAEAIPRRGCAESIRPSFLMCDLMYVSPCLPQGDASRYFADIQGCQSPRLLGPPLFKVPCRSSPQKLLLIFLTTTY